MKMQVYITKITRFDGEVEGTHYKQSKITYLDEEVKNELNKKGCETVTVKGSYELFMQVSKIPAIYEVDYKMDYTPKGIQLYFNTAKLLLEKAQGQ